MNIFFISSNLIESKKPCIACFEDTYADLVGVAINPFNEDIAIIEPFVFAR